MHTSGFEKPYPPPIIGAVEDGAAAVSEQNPLLGWAGLGQGVGAGGWRCCFLMTQAALQPGSWEKQPEWRLVEKRRKVKRYSEANELFFKWRVGSGPTANSATAGVAW